jgi:hypothetical protein
VNIDDIGRDAARDLHAHVAADVDPAAALRELTAAGPRTGRHRGRVVALAAAVVVLMGGVAFAVSRRADHRATTVEFVPTAPRIDRLPAKPDDGINSIRLPITAAPSTGLTDNAPVEVSGPGFVPGEQVAVVECVASPDGSRGGIDSCDLASITYGLAGPDGVATVQVAVRRIITTARDGTVDCAISTEKCSLGMGSISDYDRSGGVAVDFDPSQPAPDDATIAVSPASSLNDGDQVTVTGAGLTGSVIVFECRADTTGGRSDCVQLGDPATADDSGRITITVPVHRLLGEGAGAYPVDCAGYPGACVVVAQGTGQSASRTAALNFDKSVHTDLPALTLEPAGVILHDGQLVQLEGFSYAPGATVSIAECGFGPAGQAPCIEFAPVAVGGDGHFAASFAVSRTLGVGSTAFDCATEGSCQISAVPSAGFAGDDVFLDFGG